MLSGARLGELLGRIVVFTPWEGKVQKTIFTDVFAPIGNRVTIPDILEGRMVIHSRQGFRRSSDLFSHRPSGALHEDIVFSRVRIGSHSEV